MSSRLRLLFTLSMLLALAVFPARAATPAQATPPSEPASLVKDINPTAIPWPAEFDQVVTLGPDLYFIGQTPETGLELWRSDGTAAGTGIVKDIVPGPAGANPRLLSSLGGALYFTVADGPHTRLWRSDGTPAGTIPLSPPIHSITQILLVNGVVYFHGSYTEIWRSDGTPAGTFALTGAGGEPVSVWDGLWAAGNLLFFNTHNQLWRSDGTPAGTLMLLDQGPSEPIVFGAQLVFANEQGVWASDGSPAGTARIYTPPAGAGIHLLPAASRIYFLVNTDSQNAELWRSDGTPAGTALVKRITLGTGLSHAYPLNTVGDTLFFKSLQNNEWTLWRSDGTAVNTFPLKSLPDMGNLWPGFTARFGARLLLSSGNTLWISNGRPAGTIQLGAFVPAEGQDTIRWLGELGGRFFFAADDGASGRELWVTDGTPAGTRLYADLSPGGASGPIFAGAAGGRTFFVSGLGPWRLWEDVAGTPRELARLREPRTGDSWPGSLVAFGGRLFFSADDGVHGHELWVSDGTAAGTALFKDLSPDSSGSSDDLAPGALATVGQQLFFVHGAPAQLWRSDGSPAGTIPLASIDPFGDSLRSLRIVAAGTTAFVPIVSFNGNGELWRSDGTPAGTYRLRAFPSLGDWFVRSGSRIFFPADDGTNGVELWTSNGTRTGTLRLTSLPPDVIDLFTNRGVVAGGKYFFPAANATSGGELWASDGTRTGTRIVKEIVPGSRGSDPADLIAAGSRVFFSAGHPTLGRQVWLSDGTATGTKLVTRFADGGSESVAYSLLRYTADQAFFVHNDELWITSGTSAGTRQVTRLGGMVCRGSDFDTLVIPGGRLIFLELCKYGYDNEKGQLWLSDGTAAGTAIAPIPVDYYGPPQALSLGGTALLYEWYQVWASDGTVAGTRLLLSPAIGNILSRPVIAGNYVFFPRETLTHGRELWAMPRTP